MSGPNPTPAQVLAGALDAWAPAWVWDRDVNGGDLVEWFFGRFLPDACTALGRAQPTTADYPDPDDPGCDPCGKADGEADCDCGWERDHDEVQNPCRQEIERDEQPEDAA